MTVRRLVGASLTASQKDALGFPQGVFFMGAQRRPRVVEGVAKLRKIADFPGFILVRCG